MQDKLADIMLELIESRSSSQADMHCAVFHLFNPSVTSWISLVPAIQEQYQVEQVELSEWIQDLEGIENPLADEIAAKPALKLLHFYRGLVQGDGALSAPVDLTKTKEASMKMRELAPVSKESMANWLTQWAF